MEKLKQASTDYLLEDGLNVKHQESTDWISEIELWKMELAFFQKLMDNYSPKFTTLDDKKQMDHFQNLIIYYSGELLDEFAQKIRRHEDYLAQLLKKDPALADSQYRQKHGELKSHLASFESQFRMFKREFFQFMEPVI